MFFEIIFPGLFPLYALRYEIPSGCHNLPSQEISIWTLKLLVFLSTKFRPSITFFHDIVSLYITGLHVPKSSPYLGGALQPGAEDRRALVSVPIVLSFYVTPYDSFIFLVLPIIPHPPLLYTASTDHPAVLTYPITRSTLSCSHHCHDNSDPGCRSTARHISSIGKVAIYWEIVYWRRRTYVSTSYIPTSDIAESRGDITTLPPCPASVALPQDRRPHCGGILRGSSPHWGHHPGL